MGYQSSLRSVQFEMNKLYSKETTFNLEVFVLSSGANGCREERASFVEQCRAPVPAREMPPVVTKLPLGSSATNRLCSQSPSICDQIR